MKIVNILVIGFMVLIGFSGCSSKYDFKLDPKYTISEKKDKTIVSLKQGKNISMDQLVADVEPYPVIYVGDHHDTNATHKFFKEFLDVLGSKGYRIHLANEWFTPAHDELLKEFTDFKIDAKELKEKREWDKFTKHHWDLVEPLYTSVRDSGGRLYGVNISKKDRKKISLKKVDEMDKGLKTFYDDLDLNVSSHQSLVMPFFKHCHMHGKSEKSDEPCDKRMYRVQVTWDTYMAQNSAKIAKEALKTKKDKLIVFAGAMHVEYGLGIPLRFSRLNNLPSYIISNHSYDDKDKKIEIDPQVAQSVFVYKKNKKKIKIK